MLQSTGSQRAGHDLATEHAHTHTWAQRQPLLTPQPVTLITGTSLARIFGC